MTPLCYLHPILIDPRKILQVHPFARKAFISSKCVLHHKFICGLDTAEMLLIELRGRCINDVTVYIR